MTDPQHPQPETPASSAPVPPIDDQIDEETRVRDVLRPAPSAPDAAPIAAPPAAQQVPGQQPPPQSSGQPAPQQYGQPAQQHGDPAPQPAYGQPVPQQYGQPAQQSAYAQPAQQPTYGQPAQQPAYAQPAQQYGQPAAGPVPGQPTAPGGYGAPAPGSPLAPAPGARAPFGLGFLALLLGGGAAVIELIGRLVLFAVSRTGIYDFYSAINWIFGTLSFLAALGAIVFGILVLTRRGAGRIPAAAGVALGGYIAVGFVLSLLYLLPS
ncbi:hypothetical protein [Schumannella soli]|uniref:Uncharacterized protein n=1 Tax=Schumannella soli TaxID=2590779 RepID=A0A506Y6K1_9MICO|nr:hypothetical protein [Schumannella soli]TPW77150.1 hypothetical protein FJ657_00090 [Schumannella soli]